MNPTRNKRSWWMPGLATLLLSCAVAGCEVPAKQVGAGVIVPSLWVTVAEGGTHTLAIKADGTLWGWGDNTHGQLGTGDTIGHASPVQINAATSWVSVSAGLYHSLAVTSALQLWVWGDNTYGQLGTGVAGPPVLTPTPILGSTWNVLTSPPSAGCYHTIAVQLTPAAGVYGWGSNDFGQVGNAGAPNPTATPTLLGVVSAAGAAGCTHSLGVDATGLLYSWGNNDHGQLGFGYPTTPSMNVPTLVPGPAGVVRVAAGESHSLAIATPGRSLYGWGANAYGQAGSLPSAAVPVPTLVGAATNWAAIAAGQFHSVGTQNVGTVNTLWGWGRNNVFQLGDALPDRSVPSQVAPNIGNILWMATGWNHAAAINGSAALFTWGANDKGQLGDGTFSSRPLPKAIP